MHLWERLKSCREQKGYSQVQVAEKIGVKNNTLSSYESGARRPDYETLVHISKIYGVSIDYLLTGKEPKTENLFFFNKEGLSEDELDDIKNHIDYIRWKSKEKREKNEKK